MGTGRGHMLAPRIAQGTIPSAQNVGLGTWGIVAILMVALVLVLSLIVGGRR
jgi:hypothetical protein